MRSSKRRPSLVIAAVAGGALTLAVAAVAGSGGATGSPARTSPGTAHPRLIAQEANAVFRQYLSHQVTPGQVARVPHSATAEKYYNWSGYADSSTTKGAFTKVSGSWTEPKVTCGAEDQILATWVGLDGLTDTTVEQIGVDAQCFEGSAYYYTWYEMYPAAPLEIGDTVAPGDSISASVVRSATTYVLKITDSTHTANSGSATKTCKATVCFNESADWIAERPEYTTTGDVPLAHYGKWTLADGAVTSGGKAGTISSYHPVEITMIDSTATYSLSTPSSLTGGKSFTMTWDNSY
jgi:Peptidase A4 family